MPADVECLFTADAIAARVRSLGGAIRERWPGDDLTILGVLKGALLFTADLARAVGPGPELSFVQACSYGRETVSTGRVVLGALEAEALEGRRVVVADTILDTGLTLRTVVDAVRALGAADILTCVLVDKPARRAVDIRPDFVGFGVEDVFLVGYGLDHAGRYRGLPYLGVVARGPDG